MPSVSIILATLNRSYFLARAIESVIAQTMVDWELLVVDNGSTDGTEKLIREFKKKDPRIRYLLEAERGISCARNSGIQEAKGEWIAFIDDDDEWLPEKLSRQMAYLRIHPDVSLLYAKTWVKDGKGKTTGVKPSNTPALDFGCLIEKDTLPILTVVLKRECIDEVGGFDPGLRVAEDYDLWLRISRNYTIAFMDEIVSVYHDHGGNVSRRANRKFKGYQNALTMFDKLQKLSLNSQHLINIKKRVALLHYFLARQFIFKGEIFQAKEHLRESQKVMRGIRFPKKWMFLLKSTLLLMALQGGSGVHHFLTWRWMHREPSHFPNPKEVNTQ